MSAVTIYFHKSSINVGQVPDLPDPISSGPAGRKAGFAARIVQPRTQVKHLSRLPDDGRFRLTSMILPSVWPRKFRRVILILRAAVSPPAFAQDAVAIADRQIIQEIRDSNQLMDNLEYLSDAIGPRVTGTEQLNQAVNWAQQQCLKYNLENVHLEGWKIAHSWQRDRAGSNCQPRRAQPHYCIFGLVTRRCEAPSCTCLRHALRNCKSTGENFKAQSSSTSRP
jgi:hypothetical protein